MTENWTFRTQSGYDQTAPLAYYWEVNGDPISDDYTANPADPYYCSARDLLDMWAKRYGDPEDVPIHWYITGPGTFEYAPFTPRLFEGQSDFLTYYSWPRNAKTGERLNWMSLPVADKL